MTDHSARRRRGETVLGSTLNRMIFWELVRVFLLSLGTLTSLFLIVGLIQQASQLGLSLW